MTIEGFEFVIQELWTAQPFQIFTIELNDGTLCEIDFPGAMNFRQGVVMFYGPNGRLKFFDADSVLQIIPAPAEDAAK